MEDKIKSLQKRLFDKTFLTIFTEEIIKYMFGLEDRGNRSSDALGIEEERIEIKGTVLRDKGKDYRTNQPSYSKEMIIDFLDGKIDIEELPDEQLLDYENINERMFASVFNKIEFDKFDKLIGVLYFSDCIKIISFDKNILEESNSLSKQFGKGIYSLTFTRTNYKEIINKYHIGTLSYIDLFKLGGINDEEDQKD